MANTIDWNGETRIAPVEDGVNSYSYDYEERQTGMTGPGGTAEYVYDALGQRVARIVDGVVAYYVYNVDCQVIEERDSASLLQALAVFGSGVDEPACLCGQSTWAGGG